MRWLLTAIGFIGIIGFAIAGILYLISAGEDERIKQAKKAMTMSILGVIVALAGYVALQAASTFLNAGKF
jgi:multisubunit Na+/H+ antiporter MnhB subunit